MMMMMSTRAPNALLTRFLLPKTGKEERGSVAATRSSSSVSMKRSAIRRNRRRKDVVVFKTSPRAFAREYPTYDELGAQPYETNDNDNNIIIGGWQERDPGNYYQHHQQRQKSGEDFFFGDEATAAQQKSSQQQQQQQQQRRKNSAGSSSVSMVSSSTSPLASAAREWFEACFGLLKVTMPLTAMCACIAAASMHSARYTMLSQVYQLATGMTTAGVIISGFAVVASVISGFFVAASAFADLGGTSGGSSAAARRKKNKNKKSANGFQQQQQQQQGYNSSNDIFSSSYEQQSYQQQPVQQHYQQPQQQQQQRQRRKPVERYEPPVIHPTRPPSSPSKRAAREAYDSWTPEVPIVDPRAQVPRPSDVDYYSSSASAPRSQAFSQQPEWDRNESWGSYKSPGQRRREMGHEFKGTEALKNYVDPRDQYERRVSNSSPEAESVYNQYASRSNGDHLRAPRHDINNYTNPIPERDRLIPKPMERPKPGYIPTEVLIAMGGASLSTHIKNKFEDGSIREMRKQKEEFNKRKNAATANRKNNEQPSSSNATNMFGERVNPDDMFRRAR
jgi:hypothetical protein